MKTGAIELDVEDISPSILTRSHSGWVGYPHGKWRFLSQRTQTLDKFEELEIRLSASLGSILPIESSGLIKIIHMTSGSFLTVDIDLPINNVITMSTHDCLIIGSTVNFKLTADSEVTLDVTLLNNTIQKLEFERLVKYVPFEFQDDYEFFGNGAIQKFKVLIHPDMLDDQLSRCLFYVAPGENGPPFHTHPTFETFRMLDQSGPIEVAIGGEAPIQTSLTSEDYLNVYPGVIHSFRNHTEKEAKFVATLCPAGAEKTFIRFAELYAQLKAERIDQDQYTEEMNKARREGCYITRATGCWK